MPDLNQYDWCRNCNHCRYLHHAGYDSDRCEMCHCTRFVEPVGLKPEPHEAAIRELLNAAVLFEAQARQFRRVAEGLRGTTVATQGAMEPT